MAFCLHALQLSLLSLFFFAPAPLPFLLEDLLYLFIQIRILQGSKLFFIWHNSPQWATVSSFTRFLDHTQRCTTVSRIPLDEWSARSRDLYLTTHNIPHRQTSMTPVEFEPTISAGVRPQAYALDRAATGTGKHDFGRNRVTINWTTLWHSDDTNCRYCVRWQYSSRSAPTWQQQLQGFLLFTQALQLCWHCQPSA